MSRKYECSEEQFRKDTSAHVMTVQRDDGVHRHLRFRKAKPAGSEYWFDLITWPGSLVIDGDMGTYVFRRLEDMFEFFRTDQSYYDKTGRSDKLAINLGYWSEKLQASPHKGHEEFSGEAFHQRVKEAFDTWVEENQPDDGDTTQTELGEFHDTKAALWQALTDDVLSCLDDGDIRAFDAAMEFTCEDAPDFSMSECWEWNCKEYTFHFIWCCYAIAWGVKTYDTAKAVQP